MKDQHTVEELSLMMMKTMSPKWPETAWMDFDSPEYWTELKAIASEYDISPEELHRGTEAELRRIDRMKPGQDTEWAFHGVPVVAGRVYALIEDVYQAARVSGGNLVRVFQKGDRFVGTTYFGAPIWRVSLHGQPTSRQP